MKQQIIENINNPENLENLYRKNKQDFSKTFAGISQEYNSELVLFWKIRLTPESEYKFSESLRQDLYVVVILSLISGLLAKIPAIFSQVEPDSFYMKHLSIIVFNGIILFTFWRKKMFDARRILIYGSILLLLLLYVNLLPDNRSDSINLVYIHTPILLWFLFGLSYVSFEYVNTGKMTEFFRFNGELLIMTGLLLIAGIAFTGLSISLFSVIKIDIEKFYTEYIVVFGGVAIPIISYYLIQLYPNITSRIAPVIARIFTPIVLVSLVVYLITLLFSEVKITGDRDLLLLLNIMLLAVVAIVVFSISELDKPKMKNFNVLILFSMVVLAIIINTIALGAIITRATHGLTPNRTAVLGANVLIFANLILIAYNLYQSYFKNGQPDKVERSIIKFLPVYAGWTIFVIFVLPFVFGFK